MMTIHSKVCRRISRNCMSWIIMPFNQINQLIHFLIWILKLPRLLLSLMIMISSPKLLKGTMKRAKMIKMMKKVSHQRTRPSTNEVEDAFETLQHLSMFSTRGDEIRSLILNMESLLSRLIISNRVL